MDAVQTEVKGQVLTGTKGQAHAADSTVGITSDKAQQKPMAPVDYAIKSVIFETKVCFEPIYSKGKDRFYFKCTYGQEQDKVIFLTMRKDGRGICAMTDHEEYMFNPKNKMRKQVKSA